MNQNTDHNEANQTSSPQTAEITEEMIQFFNKRTQEHIDRVQKNMMAMVGYQELDLNTLSERGKIHDQSKLVDPEREGYIWLSWWHHCRVQGKGFDYPKGVDDLVKKAVDHHLHCNLHHPETHKKSDDMTWLDIVEMVCDWTAMSQEYNQGSCLNYVQQNIHKHGFCEAKKQDIFNTITEIDKRLQKKD